MPFKTVTYKQQKNVTVAVINNDKPKVILYIIHEGKRKRNRRILQSVIFFLLN